MREEKKSDLHERFAFRNIRSEEGEQAAAIEQACFPPKEACTKKMMLKRAAKARELFLVAHGPDSGISHGNCHRRRVLPGRVLSERGSA